MWRMSLLVAALLLTSSTGSTRADSCDAGNGCSVDCDNGCMALYYPDEDKCIAVCFDSKRKKRASNVVLSVKNGVKAEVEKQLRRSTKTIPKRK